MRTEWGRSSIFSRCDIDRTEIEQVGVGIVAVDFKHFGDETASRAALDLNDNIQRISDIGFDGAVWQFDAALQDAACEAGEALLRGTRVDRREGSRVSGVQELEKVKGFSAADFTELRNEYICSWCEIREGHLLAVPYPNSRCEIRRFPYPQEADIIGRVTGVAMRLAEAHS